MSEIRTFEDLDVWKRSCQLAVEMRILFHNSRDFGFKVQTSRTDLSIPSNIAEGNERDSTGDSIRFLRYAKGSCAETRTQLYVEQKTRTELN